MKHLNRFLSPLGAIVFSQAVVTLPAEHPVPAHWAGRVLGGVAPARAQAAPSPQLLPQLLGRPDAGLGTSLKLDSAGNPRSAYWDTLKRDLSYARWDGSQWVIMVVDGGG